MSAGTLILAFLAGAGLGGFFFGSLWFTVRQLPTTGWPVRLMVGSYFGRMAIALLGFYLIMQGDWRRAIAGLVGFVTARFMLMRRLPLGRSRTPDAVG
ncbi:ATP synthase subunit I [Leptolyngbya iicbica]|uniref:ATP synthase subunit I n=2 Tax=Cyanophyceae TaxID=3028117 RepID=A0A4Q7EK92_9CYAN|nr:ATP synthase subunit I [Leptolyngbya sp. LK]RZM82229.1 ATP synthase subunit I [Leptolyngbya sp. LK]